MGFFDKLVLKKLKPKINGNHRPVIKTHIGGTYRDLFSWSYNGEKNLGEVGPIRDYWPDYDSLRARSWQSYLESEITQIVIKKYALWMIGSGLKLESEPNKRVLESEKITLDTQEFSKLAEARFMMFAKSKRADHANMKSLNRKAKTAFINSIIGGDVLTVLRYKKGQLTVQLIDGAHVQSPTYGTDFYSQELPGGRTIKHGIELSSTGEHLAYYVRNRNFEYERIPAKNSAGLKTAFLVYGLDYRLDNHRGLPLISAVLETLKKLERYKEATVGSAEEIAKIVWQVVHNELSTGENPFEGQLTKIFEENINYEDNPEDLAGKKLAELVQASTNKTTVNNPVGAEVKPINASTKDLYFKDFYSMNIDLICASLNIPPEVALSKYDSNFSASRAALKDWENTLHVGRNEFSEQFYQPIYEFWLDTEILFNKISAPGYLEARVKENPIVLDSYRCARFTGATVPHVDPLKEVNAERLKLGETGKNIPLTTVEKATEALNGGDSDQNMQQYSEELKESKELGIDVSPDPVDIAEPA